MCAQFASNVSKHTENAGNTYDKTASCSSIDPFSVKLQLQLAKHYSMHLWQRQLTTG